MALTEIDIAVLALSAEPYRGRGWMDREIHARFGWSTTRFYQRLDAIVRTREALEHDPVTCRRILALGDA
jgi:hypothetical protein